jgi:hypothetical protein
MKLTTKSREGKFQETLAENFLQLIFFSLRTFLTAEVFLNHSGFLITYN